MTLLKSFVVVVFLGLMLGMAVHAGIVYHGWNCLRVAVGQGTWDYAKTLGIPHISCKAR